MATVKPNPTRTVNLDWKSLVQQRINLQAPILEYQMSNGRRFTRSINSTSGVFNK